MASRGRNVDLFFRVRGSGLKTFDDAASKVERLTGSIKQQIAAGVESETAFKALERTMKELSSANAAFVNQAATVQRYRDLTDQIKQQEAAVEKATAAVLQQKAAMEGGEKVTRAQTRELNQLTNAQLRAETQLDRLRQRAKETGEQVEQAGFSVNDLAGAEQKLAAATQLVETQMVQANAALNNYEANADSIRAKTEADAAAFARASGFADEWARAIKMAAAEQDRLARATSALRQVGADAVAAASGVDKIATASRKAAVGAGDLEAELRAVVDPAGAARDTLSGLEGELNRISADAAKADRPIREYSLALGELGQAQQALLGQAKAVQAFKDQEQAVAAAEAKLKTYRAETIRVGSALANAENPTQEMADEANRLRQQTAAAERELDRETDTLERLKAPLQRAGIDTTNLAEAQDRLRNSSRVAAETGKRLKDVFSGQGSAAGRIFGLRPNELQNLSYQVNDLVTQVASGTPIMQAFAQQAGQIVQIFPSVLTTIARNAPAFALLGAAAGVAYLGLSRLLSLESSLRTFAAALAVSADGGFYNENKLGRIAQSTKDIGLSLDTATAALKEFVNAGIAENQLPGLVQSARDFTKVFGGEVPEAAKKIASALTTGYDGVAALDDEMNILTASQRENIRAMFEQGQAAEALTLFISILEGKLDTAAQKAQGPWAKAWERIGAAINTLGDEISNGAVGRVFLMSLNGWALAIEKLASASETSRESLIRDFEENAVAIGETREEANRLKQLLSENPDLGGFYMRQLEKTELKIEELIQKGIRLKDQLDALEVTNLVQGVADRLGEMENEDRENQKRLKIGQELVAQAEKERDAARDLTGEKKIQLVHDNALRAARAKGSSEAEAQQYAAIKADEERIRVQKELDSRAQSAASAAKAEADAAAAAAKALANEQKSLISAFAQSQAQAGGSYLGDVEQRLDAVRIKYQALYDKIAELRAQGVVAVDGRSLDDIQANLQANEQIILQEERMKSNKDALKRAETDLGALIDERASLEKIYNDQVAAGQITRIEADDKIKQLYAEFTPLIDAQILKIRELITELYNTGVISEAVFNALNAKLDLVGVKTDQAGFTFENLKKQIDDAIVSGGLKAFNAVTDALGGMIDGTLTFSEGVAAMGRAFLQFAADFLRKIAEMIVQQAILNALQGDGGGGGVGGNIANLILKLFHSGKPPGSFESNRSRKIALPRYHTGYNPLGMTKDEELAILHRSEEVLTADNPRHIANVAGRAMAGAAVSSSGKAERPVVLNYIDPAQLLAKALGLPAGQKAFMNFVEENPEAMKGALGV